MLNLPVKLVVLLSKALDKLTRLSHLINHLLVGRLKIVNPVEQFTLTIRHGYVGCLALRNDAHKLKDLRPGRTLLTLRLLVNNLINDFCQFR